MQPGDERRRSQKGEGRMQGQAAGLRFPGWVTFSRLDPDVLSLSFLLVIMFVFFLFFFVGGGGWGGVFRV